MSKLRELQNFARVAGKPVHSESAYDSNSGITIKSELTA